MRGLVTRKCSSDGESRIFWLSLLVVAVTLASLQSGLGPTTPKWLGFLARWLMIVVVAEQGTPP